MPLVLCIVVQRIDAMFNMAKKKKKKKDKKEKKPKKDKKEKKDKKPSTYCLPTTVGLVTLTFEH